ncbi:ABC transporter permease [Pimelobacter simplex]|uniref:ABC transporter permease n=1 Tax=Nocardioides simplex TaxID=2045 RepID=UPI003AAE6CBE
MTASIVAGLGAAPARRSFLLGREARLRVLYVASPLTVLALWQLASVAGYLDERYFPAPTAILAALGEMTTDGTLAANLGPTMSRVLIGLALGVVPGVILGPIVGYSATARAIVQPLVDLTFPIPKLAVFPLFLIIFGLGDTAIHAVIAVSIFYLVLINCADGVQNLSTTYREVAEDSGASRWMLLFNVALPGALPPTLSGIRLAANIALLVTVATEFVGSSSGLGYLVWNSWQLFQVTTMYAGLVILAVIGFVMSVILRGIERLLVPWNR